MPADTVTEVRTNLLGVSGRRTVHRWRYGGAACHLSHEAHVAVGWHPDGWWWVDDTREKWLGWVFTGPPEAARAAAEARARQRMAVDYCHGGTWGQAIAEHVPGVLPNRAAEVPEWPPGFEPPN